MKLTQRLLLLFAFPFILTSCADDDFPQYIKLKTLRVLALQSGAVGGPAEVSPGDTVTITPYISDYYGGSRNLTYDASACFDPGLGVGVEPSCEGVTGAVNVGTGAATAPATSRTGATTTFTVTVPAQILVGRSPADQYNGVNYLVTYTLTADDGEKIVAFKRILVSDPSKTDKNNNPQPSDLLADGNSLTTLPSGNVKLQVSYPGTSTESYTAKKEDLTTVHLKEELLTTWFLTDGQLEFFRTINKDTTKYTPPKTSPSGRQPLMVGVTRDERGGVAVIVREL